ncbi:hypothetical protein [Cohnella sp.]|uniref:hypothetical protein n=1 Tax=Cohnella sp. TaxID=1883426 RepID=UPI003565DF3E
MGLMRIESGGERPTEAWRELQLDPVGDSIEDPGARGCKPTKIGLERYSLMLQDSAAG